MTAAPPGPVAAKVGSCEPAVGVLVLRCGLLFRVLSSRHLKSCRICEVGLIL